jgi:hypothetical protein
VPNVAPVYNVKNAPYNAVGDGIADDRTAIQAAIDAANAAGGGTVYLPNGTYRVTGAPGHPLGACLALKSNATLIGESREGVVVKLADAQAAFTRVLVADAVSDIVISTLTIDGNQAAQTPEEHMGGIFLRTVVRSRVDRIAAHSCCGDGITFHQDNSDVVVREAYCHDNLRGGIAMTGTGSKRVTFDKVILTGNGNEQLDIELSSAGVLEDIHLLDSYLVDADGAAVTFSGFNDANPSNGFVMDGCYVEGQVYMPWAKGVRISRSRIVAPGICVTAIRTGDVVVDDCDIKSTATAPGSFGAMQFEGSTGGRPDVTINNCRIETTTNFPAIRAISPKSIVVRGGRIWNNATATTSPAIRVGETLASGIIDRVHVEGVHIVDFVEAVFTSGTSGTQQIKSLVIANNTIERSAIATMFAFELNNGGVGVVRQASILGNVTIGLTDVFAGTGNDGWPSVATLIAGTRGDGGCYSGNGSPNGVVTETPGASYIQRDSVGGSLLWRKEAGTGSTGWMPVGTAPNLVRNSGFYLAQRQAPATLTTYSATAGRAITADGWGVSNENASVQYQRVDTFAAPEAGLVGRYYGSWKKITAVGKMAVSQVIEAARVAAVRGKTVQLSLKMKSSTGAGTMRLALVQLSSAGAVDSIPATFIAAWGAVSADPTMGANLAYVTPIAGLVENATISGSAVSCVLTAAWKRFGAYFTVPSDCKNLVVLAFTDGQADINGAVSIAEVVLSDVAQPWQPTPLEVELTYARRFYQKTFGVEAAPAQNAGAGTGELTSALWKAGAAVEAAIIPWRFTPEMRAAPTVTTFNPSAANAEARQTGGTASDLTATAAGSTTATQTVITATGVGTGVAGDRTAVHATADAEL